MAHSYLTWVSSIAQLNARNSIDRRGNTPISQIRPPTGHQTHRKIFEGAYRAYSLQTTDVSAVSTCHSGRHHERRVQWQYRATTHRRPLNPRWRKCTHSRRRRKPKAQTQGWHSPVRSVFLFSSVVEPDARLRLVRNCSSHFVGGREVGPTTKSSATHEHRRGNLNVTVPAEWDNCLPRKRSDGTSRYDSSRRACASVTYQWRSARENPGKLCQHA